MAYFTNFTTLHRLLCRRRRLITSLPPPYHSPHLYANPIASYPNSVLLLYPILAGKRWLSSNSEWAGQNAYDILRVSQTSSFAEIKASFRKLAKETHPDLAHSQNHSSDASNKFIQILAAYEILSDSTKRAHYDRHISSQRTFTERHSKRERDTTIFNYNSYGQPAKQMEVVEWLKWYRYTINDILSERRVTAGTGYFDVLERDFYSAIHAAYYGPEIESADLLPDRFEAEERSINATSEVLHLVSGRDLFGMVCLANKYCELSHAYTEKLTSAVGSIELADSSGQCQPDAAGGKDFQKQPPGIDHTSSDAYRDLVLHVSGRVVAVATRVPPKSLNLTEDEDYEDKIHVYLTSCEDPLKGRQVFPGDMSADSSVGPRIPLGAIKGLGTSSEEGTCYVYNNTGMKTHMIMKHRTMLVKHLHWFRIGEEVSVCECRCTRARLPPSRFWLFEPRSAMHDVGGWYVETFGRDRKGKNVPAQRYWDGLEANEHFDERLHPAMYLFALAYRTLDIEDIRRRKKTIKDRVEAKMSRVFSWYKKVP